MAVMRFRNRNNPGLRHIRWVAERREVICSGVGA